jgi:mRNA-degrading endonuclease RelE of RelBE toxin-antitoxin system
MVIRETAVFSKQVDKLLDAESYRLLQLRLLQDPEAGARIKRSGGLRKMRWKGSGRGKRGGVRTIYYWAASHDVILMLLMYPKSEQEDLSAEQLKALAALVREEFK